MIGIYERDTNKLVKAVKSNYGWIDFCDRQYNKYVKQCKKNNVTPLNKTVWSYTYYSLAEIVKF